MIATNTSLVVHICLSTCRCLSFLSAPASCRIASHQPVALPRPPIFTSPIDGWLLCYCVLRHPPGLVHPMVPVVFLSPIPLDCCFTPPPTHGCAATAHRPNNATTIVPLTCCCQCHRQCVRRCHQRPSDEDALPPAPHGCTAAAAPTTLQPPPSRRHHCRCPLSQRRSLAERDLNLLIILLQQRQRSAACMRPPQRQATKEFPRSRRADRGPYLGRV